MAITYKPINASALDAVNVFLDGKPVGRIQRERQHAGGWYYKPSKSNTRGEVFSTIEQAKASLEMEPEENS